MITPPASVRCRVALVGVLAAAVLLAACGRKGPLEPPPSAQATAPAIDPATGEPRPAMSQDGYPVAPPGANKPIALDVLID